MGSSGFCADPRVEHLELTENVIIETDLWRMESDDAYVNVINDGYGSKFEITAYRGQYKMKPAEEKVACKIPELYPENLRTLAAVMEQVEVLSSIDGVFEVEVRVRVDDVDIWAVLGYGESGDPCILRFEEK